MYGIERARILSPAVECISFPDAIHMGNDTHTVGVGGGRYNHIEGGEYSLPLLLLALCTRNNVSVRNFFSLATTLYVIFSGY